VVEAALRLADDEGLESLTMPALARRLGCGVMTIYGYVDHKEDLLDGLAERGLRDLQLPHPLPVDTAGILLAWGESLRLNLLRHPALPVVFLSRPVIGPGILRGVEALLGPLAGTGMPPARGVHAIYAVLTYVTGFVGWEIPRTHQQSKAAYAASWQRQVAGLPRDALPVLTGVIDELPEVAGERQFEFGLTALVAGLAVHTGEWQPSRPAGDGADAESAGSVRGGATREYGEGPEIRMIPGLW
jgi:TetR/AcrR family tetracycline transcriptional repressor